MQLAILQVVLPNCDITILVDLQEIARGKVPISPVSEVIIVIRNENAFTVRLVVFIELSKIIPYKSHRHCFKGNWLKCKPILTRATIVYSGQDVANFLAVYEKIILSSSLN